MNFQNEDEYNKWKEEWIKTGKVPPEIPKKSEHIYKLLYGIEKRWPYRIFMFFGIVLSLITIAAMLDYFGILPVRERLINYKDLVLFKKADLGNFSLHMEFVIRNPSKIKIEEAIESLTYFQNENRKSLQVDIFDDLEALARRGDENYPGILVFKHWLVSITEKEIYRFYLKERPDIY